MELKFIKQKISQGVHEKTGYYLGDEFLDRYKTKAIEILRNRIIKAGNGDFQAGKNKARKEWEVVHKEYLKSVEATKKTNKSKKEYFNRLSQITKQNRINRLKSRIEYLEDRRKLMNKEFDDKIKLIEKEIKQIEN